MGKTQPDILTSRKRPFAILRFPHQRLQGDGVFPWVTTVFVHKLFGDKISNTSIPIDTSQHHVAAGRDRRVGLAIDFQQGDIERATAEIVDQDRLAAAATALFVDELFLNSVGDCRGSWFVDDIQDIQACHLAGVLGPPPPGLIEVCRHGDDGLGEIPQFQGSVLLQLFQDQRLDDLRRQLFPTDRAMKMLIPHVPLRETRHHVRFELRCLGSLGPHDHLSVVEQHDAGSGRVSFTARDCPRTPLTIQVRDDGKRRAQVDTNGRCLRRTGHGVRFNLMCRREVTSA